MSDAHGRPTGPSPSVAVELDAARADYWHKRALAEESWDAYKAAESDAQHRRARWQSAEADAFVAGKRYAAALRAYEARQGQRGSEAPHGAPARDAP